MFFVYSCTFGCKLKMDLASNLPSLRQISVINLSIYAYLILLFYFKAQAAYILAQIGMNFYADLR